MSTLAIDFVEGSDVPAMILEAIEECGADLVIMSRQGRSGLERWRFVSGAQRAARHSPAPVVLVQPKRQ